MKISRIIAVLVLANILLTACSGASSAIIDKEYVLTTDLREGNLIFLGVSDEINGQANPTLSAEPGETITVTLINGGMGQHSLSFPAMKASTDVVMQKGETVSVTFRVPNKDVTLDYIDGVGNNAELGMKGVLLVGKGTAIQSNVELTGVTVSYAL
jgi:nitrite reductase (NO-forming)